MTENDLQKPKGYRDTISTVTTTGSRKWVYATKPKGFFYNIRSVVSYFYLLVFFLIPFIKVNKMPLVLLNVVEGKFILFSKIFWPQDFFIFAIGMVTFIVFIALFTVIYGRLFCGWACPQTIFMEFVFRKIEWWIEGPPSKQKKDANGHHTQAQLIRKAIKNIVFVLISFLIANTFLSYIIGVDELFKIISEPIEEHIGLLTGLLFFTFLFYLVYAYVREIVCTTICPYGRLQSVLFDKDSMQISYDYSRGEDRGKIVKGTTRELGDCIDCKLCVQVCPTGIDIRNGLQMECVGCTACIDACNGVMEKVGFEKGLIRYASENSISKAKKFYFNGRMKAYSVLLVFLIALMSFLIATRKSVDTYITRVKGQLYQEVDANTLSNLYAAKIINKTRDDIFVNFKIENSAGKIRLVGKDSILLKKESLNEITFFIDLPKTEIEARNNKIKVGVYRNNEKIQTVKTTFLGPFK